MRVWRKRRGDLSAAADAGVEVDEWVDDFGSTQLTPTLRFEDGRLATIETGGCGH